MNLIGRAPCPSTTGDPAHWFTAQQARFVAGSPAAAHSRADLGDWLWRRGEAGEGAEAAR